MIASFESKWTCGHIFEIGQRPTEFFLNIQSYYSIGLSVLLHVLWSKKSSGRTEATSAGVISKISHAHEGSDILLSLSYTKLIYGASTQ